MFPMCVDKIRLNKFLCSDEIPVALTCHLAVKTRQRLRTYTDSKNAAHGGYWRIF